MDERSDSISPPAGPYCYVSTGRWFIFSSLTRVGLRHSLHQFAGKKVAATKAKSGIRQDILGIIVSFLSVFGRPSRSIFCSKMKARVDLYYPNNKLPLMRLSLLWLAPTPFLKGLLLSSDILLATRRYKLSSVLKSMQPLMWEMILILSNYQSFLSLMLAFRRCFASFPLLLLVRLLNVHVLSAKFGEYSRKLTELGPPRYSEKDDQVLGRSIPAGTTVACPTYTLHRDCEKLRFFLTDSF